jgi:hypothetical protein
VLCRAVEGRLDDISVLEADAHIRESGEDGNVDRFALHFGIQVPVAKMKQQRGYPFGRNSGVTIIYAAAPTQSMRKSVKLNKTISTGLTTFIGDKF